MKLLEPREMPTRDYDDTVAQAVELVIGGMMTLAPKQRARYVADVIVALTMQLEPLLEEV